MIVCNAKNLTMKEKGGITTMRTKPKITKMTNKKKEEILEAKARVERDLIMIRRFLGRNQTNKQTIKKLLRKIINIPVKKKERIIIHHHLLR